jgi:hypothetical protein
MRSRKLLSANHAQSSRGQILAFGASGCLFIAILGFVFFEICMLIGGAKEFRNSVDAGTLGVARFSLLNPNVPIPDPTNPFYRIASDTYGNINIENVNMVIGQAWLVRANEYDMEQNGTSTGFAANGSALNANQLNQQAGQIVGELCNQLNDVYGNFKDKFQFVSQSNAIRMFASGCIVNPAPANWQSAYLNASGASNVWIAANSTNSEIPASCVHALASVSKTIESKDYNYMPGYVADSFSPQFDLGPPIPFITLEPTIKPYLFDTEQFNNAVTPPSGLDPRSKGYLVPNGFSSTGKVKVPLTGQTMQFTSTASLGEIHTGSSLAIPSGVVRIENRSSNIFPQLECINNPRIFQFISQRAQEISPKFTTEKLVSLLSQPLPTKSLGCIYSPPNNNPGATSSLQQKTAQPDGTPWPIIPCSGNPKQGMQCTESSGANGVLFVVRVVDLP